MAERDGLLSHVTPSDAKHSIDPETPEINDCRLAGGLRGRSMSTKDSYLGKFLSDRRCPCCDAGIGKPAVWSVPAGESFEWSALRDSWRGFFKRNVFLTYVRCQSCGLLYGPRYFTDSCLKELYGNMPDNSVGLPHAILERTQRHYFEFLERHSDFAGNYLELGPDIGLFTQHVARLRRSGCLWLYEPNLAVHDELSHRLAGLDARIHAEMADLSAIPDASVSVCVMIHVLDHLPNAKALLQQIRRKLRADARVFIVTHDERSLLARALGRRWPAYCLQHSQLFNISTTERFLRECGLIVIETRKSRNYFPATYLLKHLFFAIGLRSLAMKIKGDSFVIPLRLGNIMTVARPQ